MNFSTIKPSQFLSTLVAIVLFGVVSLLYFMPQFQGESLPQGDVRQFEGMNREISLTREATGEDPQWTGAMFSGMPAFLINVAYPAQAVKSTIGKITKVMDTPAAFMFFAMTAMWLMLLMFGVNPWIGIVAALAYGLSTYFLLIIEAGHITKMWALVYAPLMMGGAWMTLRGNMWYGAALTALFTSLEIGANHPQITYYFLMAMALLWLSEGIYSWKEKNFKPFLHRTALLTIAGLLAAASNFSPLWYTARHTHETIRGGSELAIANEASDAPHETSKRGLDLEYATAWSYGPKESFNLLIPDFMGRDSGQTLPTDGATAAFFNQIGQHGMEQQLPAYWGEQPFTGGPTYLGAVAIFLAMLGLLLSEGRNRWWCLAISILMLMLAWGRHFMGLTEFFFDYLPGYNKFRTVSMTLVVVQWTIPLLGAWALMHLWQEDVSKAKLQRGIYWSLGSVGGLCLLMILFGGSLFSFGETETQTMLTDYFHRALQYNHMESMIRQGLDVQWGMDAAAAIATDRLHIMQSDAWRSLLLVVLSAGVVGLYVWKKINRYMLIGGLSALMLLDLVPVDRRFLSAEDFGSKSRSQITATAADKSIMADKTPGFRVLNLTVSPFNDATTSYFHRSVGGYHGAKLARYQDLIDHYLSSSQPNEEILNMLNTRYLIVPSQNRTPQAILRPTANGAAWFVENVMYAEGAEEEINLLGQVDTKRVAILDKDDIVQHFGEGEVELLTYIPHHLTYRTSSTEGGLVVFSEIFTKEGWTATIDGEPQKFFRADYVLRALEVPAGEHTIEWKYRAENWTIVEGITLTASLLVLAGALIALLYALKNIFQQKTCPQKGAQ